MPFSQTSQPSPHAPRVGRFPVVLDEADVVHQGIEAERTQRAEIQLLEIIGRGLDGDLELVVVLQAKRIFAIAPIGGAPRGLHISRAPGLRSDGAQKRGRVEGARAHLHVIGLQNHAALVRPVRLQLEYQVLEGARRRGSGWTHAGLVSATAASIRRCPTGLGASSPGCTAFARRGSKSRTTGRLLRADAGAHRRTKSVQERTGCFILVQSRCPVAASA